MKAHTRHAFFLMCGIMVTGVCFGNDFVIYKHNPDSNSITSGEILTIAIAPDNTKWFGSLRDGISKYDGSQWTSYDTADGFTYNRFSYTSVKCIAIARDGTIWVGAGWPGSSLSDDRVFSFDGATWVVYETFPPAGITSIAIDTYGRKWIGRHYNGIYVIDEAADTAYDTSNSGLPRDRVFSIAASHNGTMWFGTTKGAISFDGTDWMTYTKDDGLSTDTVTAIATARNGSVWFGTTQGISVLSGDEWTGYTTENSKLHHNEVRDIAIDTKGRGWCVTRKGVSSFDGSEWTAYEASGRIYTVAIDCTGNKWFGMEDSVAMLPAGSESIEHKSAREHPHGVTITAGKTNIVVTYHTSTFDATAAMLCTPQGRCIRRVSLPQHAGRCSYTINTRSLPNGSYIVRVRTGNRVVRERILLVR